MRIRDYQAKDAAVLAVIFNRAVAEIASSFYTPKQIVAWLGGGVEAGETHGRAVWVATDLEDDGHIDMLFCQPDWAARGIASGLYALLEASARHDTALC